MEMMNSFMDGGYYSYNLTDKLTVVAINSIYWDHTHIDVDGDVAWQQPGTPRFTEV